MKISKSHLLDGKTISITGSKSISNRLLILGKLFGDLKIENLSNSQDTQLLQKALNEDSEIVDIHHAGTAMRFLTSFYAIQEGRKTILTGSERMKQRPIKPLVDALRELGAEINYLESEGFPPLEIHGKKIEKNFVKIPANISSQFITSLLLIGASLENGLEIDLQGEITSRSYIKMTLKILKDIGVETHFEGNTIKILSAASSLSNQKLDRHYHSSKIKHYIVESDWSSASYFYSLVAIGKKKMHLKSFYAHSLQGDSALKEIYLKFFGVNTISDAGENKITLLPDTHFQYPEKFVLDMNDCPDIAQTVCVTCVALKLPFEISGLGTLKVKETDRLVALQNELEKIGCRTEITENSIKSLEFFESNSEISIATYNDHRMAMSFAPFALVKELDIQNEDVVEKSYPDFWTDFFEITEKS
ncbi:3-phosphoshikimate 1-carboxyvinyltransferase [Cloacibacterium normanense]|uniref:3-phosphoshikimate 1-carboxyvinyltransferase n=1 Tax=Cloacibacterium normanense TaxID=237258 RepID=A0A2S7I3Q6_9FLAO|nr:3-phosphoshikimate 1-carboxyvinyltransferase [Cloacibacterium normanense]PPZ91203.1 3-phosphoshikimate 1-carboxyvinyltransferase [Cloacibacterium normanense]